MKLSVFVSALGWASLFALVWLLLLDVVTPSFWVWVAFVFFLLVSLWGGALSVPSVPQNTGRKDIGRKL